MSIENKPDLVKLLKEAINEPGKMLEAYRAFHRFSTNNQLLARLQCYSRGLEIGPLASFKAWQEKGRCVKKGEKAISLLMPITIKKDEKKKNGEDDTFTFFKLANRWFVFDQTQGEDITFDPIPGWDKARALTALEITEEPFKHIDGNCQGYAHGRTIAVNPLAQLPAKTTFHELAHIVLGHTKDDGGLAADLTELPKDIKEVEAESVALLCLASLDLPGVEYCRGYIQNWIVTDDIDEKSAKRILSATDKILKAGQEKGAA